MPHERTNEPSRQPANSPAAAPKSANATQRNPKPMLGILFATAFVAAFNENIVNVGLPDIMQTFAIDANTANWLVTGYMIVSAIVVTIIAFLLRRFTLRQVFFGGSAIFVAGSALAMLAPTFPILLLARLVQAVGTGMFIPTMMNTVLAVAPRKKLATYLSIGGCCITFGPAFGPVVSGLMVTLLGWRGMFLVPCAAMAVLLLLGAAFVYDIAEPKRLKLDLASVLLSALGLTALVYGLAQISASLLVGAISLALGLVLLAVFVMRQTRLQHPLLNLQPMRSAGFARVCALVVVAMMTTFSMSVLLPLYFEGALGSSAFLAGLFIVPPILLNALTALLGGRIMDRWGEWPLLPAGFAIIVAGQAAVALVAGSLDLLAVIVAASITYAGVGLVFSPSQTSGLKTLPPELNPHGVAIINTLIMIAAALGPSLFVGLLSTTLAQAGNGAAAHAQGFSLAVWVACGIAVVGCALSFIHARKAATSQAASPVAASTSAPQPLQLGSVMKRDVFTVSDTAPVQAAIALMLEHHTSGLPVVDAQGTLKGFVTDGDIMKSLADADPTLSDLRFSLSVFANDPTFDERMNALMNANVMDIATEQVVSVAEDTPIEQVCTLLGERRIKKLPVLSHGKLVGTVSRSDVNRHLMQAFLAKQAG